jgi:nitric oxide dioxygenase
MAGSFDNHSKELEMLDHSEIDILRDTALLKREQSAAAAAKFYDTLFEMSPDLRPLFPEQMTGQERKFAATLAIAVNSLSDWDALVPVIEALARRHLTYGVEASHYSDVAAALIATLQAYDATEQQLEAWTRVYGKLADHMIATAY